MKYDNKQIRMLQQSIKENFHLTDEQLKELEYSSIEELNEAFGDNVVWQERKRDIAIIICSLLEYLLKNPDIHEDPFFNLDLFFASLMPSVWNFKWEDNFVFLKYSIDPFLREYDIQEASAILQFLFFVKDSFLVTDRYSKMLNDVMDYWTQMVYKRDQLIATKIILEKNPQIKLKWNDFLNRALDRKG